MFIVGIRGHCRAGWHSFVIWHWRTEHQSSCSVSSCCVVSW